MVALGVLAGSKVLRSHGKFDLYFVKHTRNNEASPKLSIQKKKKKVISIELFTSVFLMNFAEVLDTSVFMAKGTALPRLGAA